MHPFAHTHTEMIHYIYIYSTNTVKSHPSFPPCPKSVYKISIQMRKGYSWSAWWRQVTIYRNTIISDRNHRGSQVNSRHTQYYKRYSGAAVTPYNFVITVSCLHEFFSPVGLFLWSEVKGMHARWQVRLSCFPYTLYTQFIFCYNDPFTLRNTTWLYMGKMICGSGLLSWITHHYITDYYTFLFAAVPKFELRNTNSRYLQRMN